MIAAHGSYQCCMLSLVCDQETYCIMNSYHHLHKSNDFDEWLGHLCMKEVVIRLIVCIFFYQDEVHERDRFCDFLLIKLKQLAYSRSSPRHPKFKLILMSAALDADLFINYFNNCPVINSKNYSLIEIYE